MAEIISVRSGSRAEIIDITAEVENRVRESGVKEGICLVYSPHTTTGITINESADPSVKKDISAALGRMVPAGGPYLHSEGNSDAHIKSALMGSGRSVIISRGRLLLGTWQGIFFCEFDGPRSRKVHVKIIPG